MVKAKLTEQGKEAITHAKHSEIKQTDLFTFRESDKIKLATQERKRSKSRSKNAKYGQKNDIEPKATKTVKKTVAQGHNTNLDRTDDIQALKETNRGMLL